LQISRGKIEGAQKVCLYGPEGIGKSTFASQFPDPLFEDTEGSTKHMDVARAPKSSSWTMIIEHVKDIIRDPGQCGTYVIDTADWAERLCKEQILSKAQKNSLASFDHGKGYVFLAEEFGRLLNLLEEVIEKGVNVVIVAHAITRKFEQPDELGGYDRWEMKLEKKVFPLIKEWADMILFANYKTYAVKGEDERKKKAQGGKRVMYTTHHPCWDAKNRHRLPEELPFEYQAIAHCIPSRNKPEQSIPKPAEPEQVSPFLEDDPALKEPTPEQVPQTEPESPKQETQDMDGVPKALMDLMTTNNVTVGEIQRAVADKGYYPINTPISNYDPSFINGVLVGAWGAVYKMIQDFRSDEPY